MRTPSAGQGDQRDGDRLGMNCAEAERYRLIKKIETAATQVFLNRGYDGTTMDMVAASARMSKATLYAYFPAKHILFERILYSICVPVGDIVTIGEFEGATGSLAEVGMSLLGSLTSPRSIALARVVIGVMPRYPQFGATLYRHLICSYQPALVNVMRHLHTVGRVNVPNAEEAANAFLTLLIGDFFLRRIFGVDDVNAEEQVVAIAVSAFMSRYCA